MEEAQFDENLGGSTPLPSRLNLGKFMAARSQEVQALRSNLALQQSTRLAFQTLPKHMRRRAMSHNAKRLPRRLRQIHLNQMKKSGAPITTKRPARKYRRRPRNLIEEYTKRSEKTVRWLQTHIWHAKRFHMVTKWGYKLPQSPCDKAFRACYRAVSKHCLVQDISYFNCIEIMGEFNFIVEKIKCLTRPVGLGIGAKAFASGRRQGQLMLFTIAGQAIGHISFMWNCKSSEQAQLWLWVHPAFASILNDNLKQIFNLSQIVVRTITNFSRFRLTGPLSHAILQDAFKLADSPKETWLKEYFGDGDNSDHIQEQLNYWKSLKDIRDVSEISPHIILPLLVRDPRLNLPKKRTKCLVLSEDCLALSGDNGFLGTNSSPLWSEEFRNSISKAKISDGKIGERRSQFLVPGTDLSEQGDPVPVILVQRPGCRTENLGFGSGWDLIVPSAWSTAFWIAIVMRCARPGGLREADSINFESGNVPFLSPDSEAGQCEEALVSETLREKFFRRPPNKRTNYNKFKIACPLSWKWSQLLNDWHPNGGSIPNFYVLRDVETLGQVQDFIKGKGELSDFNKDNCLIPVRLICDKGAPKAFAVICLPQKSRDNELLEPLCPDLYKKQRKQCRLEHMALLKKLRRQRVNKRKKGTKVQIDNEHLEMLKAYNKKMRSLWLPEIDNIKNFGSKPVIGLVRFGDFSFCLGQNSAIGYIAANCLAHLANLEPRNKVLFRNNNSRQYKWARLNVII